METWADIIRAVKTPYGVLSLFCLIVGVGIGGVAVSKLSDERYLAIVIVFCLVFLGFGLFVFVRFVLPHQPEPIGMDRFRVLMGILAREIHDALKDYLAAEGQVKEAESWARLLCLIGRPGEGEDADVAVIRASLANQLHERVMFDSPELRADIASWASNMDVSFPIVPAEQ
jgi:hypothetical protein